MQIEWVKAERTGDAVRLPPSATPTKGTQPIARYPKAAVARGLPQPRKTNQ
jgi:hypothetical protein